MGYGGYVLVIMLLCLGYCGGKCGGTGMWLLWLYGCYGVFSISVSISFVMS